MHTDATWGLRSILGPVLTRLTIYGTHPVDIESAMQQIEQASLRSVLDLQRHWATIWQARSAHYRQLAEQAKTEVMRIRMLRLACQCHYALYLINYQQLADKQTYYREYADLYRRSLTHNVRQLTVPVEGQQLDALLHLPDGDGPHPCTLVLAGLGSCKEEMHMLVEPMLARGIAVMVPDLPGCGSAIYQQHVQCTRQAMDTAISQSIDVLCQQPEIDPQRIGSAGLCMGGGLAFMAGAVEHRLSFVATLFPLIINQVAPCMIPSWMISGSWFELVAGSQHRQDFIDQMGLSGDEQLSSPFLMIHSEHDNWMPLAQAQACLFDKAVGERELIVVNERPVLSDHDSVTHSMPVGEQMHWCKEVLSDWIYQQVN